MKKPLGPANKRLQDKRPRPARAKVIGQNLKPVKKLNPSKRLANLRPGLTTSRATGG